MVFESIDAMFSGIIGDYNILRAPSVKVQTHGQNKRILEY